MSKSSHQTTKPGDAAHGGHTCAMHLLQARIDMAVIALWLGHESIETTHIYVEADLAMKERALERSAAGDFFGPSI